MMNQSTYNYLLVLVYMQAIAVSCPSIVLHLYHFCHIYVKEPVFGG